MFYSVKVKRSFMVAVSFGLCCSLTMSSVAAAVILPNVPAAARVTITQPLPPAGTSNELRLPGLAQKLYSSIPGTLRFPYSRLNTLSEILLIEDLQHQIRSGGYTSITTAIALNNVAMHLAHMGSFSRAETQYLRAINILKHAGGDNEIAIAIVQQNLADMYNAEHHFLPALSLYRQSLSTLEKRLGSQHDSVRAVKHKYEAMKVRFIANTHEVR